MEKKNSTVRKLVQILLPILITALIAGIITFAESRQQKEQPSAAAYSSETAPQHTPDSAAGNIASLDVSQLPAYDGTPYVTVNNNKPDFLEKDLTAESFEYYGALDYLGRCTACFACIGTDLMPTEKRGNISSVKPTGWHAVSYSIVDGGSLYNRSHLIAYQLTGENANERNLITGTRYMNATGMLPFEESVGNYVRTTGNHVLYRVTPVFVGDELVARGVQMEAQSIEDNGEGICFNVYCFNVQPGIQIDYLTGDSELLPDGTTTAQSVDYTNCQYVLNTRGKKFHLPGCPAIDTIKDSNKEAYNGTREELIEKGYTPCGQCNP